MRDPRLNTALLNTPGGDGAGIELQDYPVTREAWVPWLPLADFEGQAGIALAQDPAAPHNDGGDH